MAKDVVLTAASCIKGNVPGTVQVIIKRDDLKSNQGGEVIGAKELIIHNKCLAHQTKCSYNYGLIVLQKATTQKVTLIKLSSKTPTTSNSYRVVGWSKDDPGQINDRPMKVSVSKSKCSKKSTIGICMKGKSKKSASVCKVASGKYQTGVRTAQRIVNNICLNHCFPKICRCSTRCCW